MMDRASVMERAIELKPHDIKPGDMHVYMIRSAPAEFGMQLIIGVIHDERGVSLTFLNVTLGIYSVTYTEATRDTFYVPFVIIRSTEN